jgi:hypothetical protein
MLMSGHVQVIGCDPHDALLCCSVRPLPLITRVCTRVQQNFVMEKLAVA